MLIRAVSIASPMAFCLLLVLPLATTADLNYVVSSSPPLILVTSLFLSPSRLCTSMCSLKRVDEFSLCFCVLNVQALAVVSDIVGVLHGMGVSL